ncbi:GMC oxidoreductase [Paraflavitalea sp. CAU 1676]|uniref:GMC family oxidoreductase N-terminal domain-containing protein n=1 Tax=Paraflavitalea sp. CAU 1676 TaxID=3032598 RepID=UPI0023DAAADD|nr:GMC oxidoreductase [Paraflavitalea sp. CAU 1676]MDF2189166.1 GMC oxidoreductase [Paraflavitalea sp. CAU 1676]
MAKSAKKKVAAAKAAPKAATKAGISAVQATYAVLYDVWFPISALPIPPNALASITTISQQVQNGFWAYINAKNPAFLALLTALANPTQLPFYPALKQSNNAAIQRFISNPLGMGGLTRDQVTQVLSFFFTGTAGPFSTQVAMMVREAFLSAIWDLPLAVPLTGIQAPTTFVTNPVVYSQINKPVFPATWLTYDAGAKLLKAKTGSIDYLIIGSGPAGAAMAHELQQAGKKVLLIEQGPWVVWGSMDTMSYSRLMFNNDAATTIDNSVILRSGQAMGGGSTVNIDLAFSPLESTIQARVAQWIENGWLDGQYYTQARVAAAYQWVRNAIGTRTVSQSELNRDNKALWDGANRLGVDPSLYHLNRFPEFLSPSPVTQKRDAARELILPAALDKNNPLAVLPDMAVQQLTFASTGTDGSVKVTGALLQALAPWAGADNPAGNTIVDPYQFNIAPGTIVKVAADNVILSAGTIGSAKILLNTAKTQSAVKNPRVGKGLIMHPSFPLIGVMDERINLLEGLDSATYLEAFGVSPGFIFETMGALPAYGAILIPGSGVEVYNKLIQFNNSVGFGVMLVDTPSDNNYVALDGQGNVVVNYALSDSDKQRFRIGVGLAIRMMFLAGAKQVIIPTNENVLNQSNFDPMKGVYLTDIKQAELVEKNLHFLPNRTILTSAHLQATNKLGTAATNSVASPGQRIWNVNTGKEIPNLYLMDSSMFPTSVGANPMQSLYTFARIFSDRLLGRAARPAASKFSATPSDEPAIGPRKL